MQHEGNSDLSDVGSEAAEASHRDSRGVTPEVTTGCWSTITFSWLGNVIAEGYRREVDYNRRRAQDPTLLAAARPRAQLPDALTEDDLYELRPDDAPELVRLKIEAAWRQEEERPGQAPSLRRALARAFGRTFIVAGLFKIVYDSLQILGPFLLQRFLKFVVRCEHGGDCDIREGLLYAALMCVSALVQTALLHQYFHRCFRTGMRLNAAAISLVYGKALRIAGPGQAAKANAGTNEESRSARSTSQRTTGEVVNLMAVDAQRLQDTMTYLHTLWSGPYQITITLIFLAFVVGWATLAGLAVMLLQIPLMAVISRRVKLLQRRLMTAKDERVKVTNEVFGAVRLLKMYGWEASFQNRLDTVRNLELRHLTKYQIFNILTNTVWAIAPIATSVATLTLYTFIYGSLDPSTAFTAMSLFNVLRFPLFVFPNMVSSSLEALVALERIQAFMGSPEIPGRTAPQQAIEWTGQGEKPPVVKITEAKLDWPDGTPLLSNISFTVPAPEPKQTRAHLTVVLGAVGAGKTGLLQALIGDLSPTSGAVMTSGTIAYTAQSAWIRNATVKDNILFNSPFDEERYDAVVEACALLPDLAILPSGDMTEVGEKGVTLSGGQKQRICLARAVYASSKLLLLDDPLSAVDAEVAKKLMRMLRSPLVAASSIVLCTHHLQAVKSADQVILIERVISSTNVAEGRVAFCGSAADFQKKHVEQADASLERTITPNDGENGQNGTPEQDGKEASQAGKGRLMETEVERAGSVTWQVYKTYLNAAGGIKLGLAVLLGFACGQALMTSADSWISFWSDHSKQTPGRTYVTSEMGILGYLGFTLAAVVGVATTSAIFRLTALKAARSFHEQLIDKLLRLPTVFYDTTPLGRVLNRCSKDIYAVDEQLQQTMYGYMSTLTRVCATFVVITFATPWFLVLVLPILWMYRWTQNYYIPSSRQLKRIESNLRSPIFAHFSETLDGVSSVRAYGQQAQFIEENLQRMRRNLRAYYLNTASNRWLAVRLETLGTTIVTSASLLAVLNKGVLSAGVAGLSISYALSVTQALNWVVRMTSDRETNIVSVERLSEYIQRDAEPPRSYPQDPSPRSWPTEGGVKFENVTLRYRPELPLVLNGFSLEVRPREKLGICGRTGAGKSSVLNVLLRIVEPEGGRTLIDGIDILTVGLHRLRHSITIIPQDPVLFSGSLRFNLDPLEEASGVVQLWQALQRAHLAAHCMTLASPADTAIVSREAACLEATVAERGGNFSQGQRQQLCLARALLRDSNRILLLDEATSSVDAETDASIQETIRKEFASHTVLCIAHRISTIMDSDRVCVLDKGELAELGTPSELMQTKDSRFQELARLDASAH